MVERFAKEHLGAHAVVGCDLEYSRLRRSTGLLKGSGHEAVATRVRALFAGDDRPDLGIGGSEMAPSFLTFCQVRDRTYFCLSPTLFFSFSLGKMYSTPAQSFKHVFVAAADFLPGYHPCTYSRPFLPMAEEYLRPPAYIR
jgi:hypothetical protein